MELGHDARHVVFASYWGQWWRGFVDETFPEVFGLSFHKYSLEIEFIAEGGGDLHGFATGAEGAHADVEHGPAGERGDFGSFAAFEFKEAEDQAVVGRELIEDVLQKRGGGGFAGVVVTVIQCGFFAQQHFLLCLAEICGAQLGAGGFVAEAVAADIERDAGNPMLQRHAEVVARQMFEGAHERFLRQIFDGFAPREVAARDGGDTRMQAPHEFTRRRLATAAQPGLGEFVIGA